MKRLYIIAVAIMVALLNCNNISAENLPALPDDPRTLKGRLDNGLSYIIVKSTSQKGYVNFRMAQKSGYSVEGENERGMTRMLSSLATKGSRNFQDSTMLVYLSSIGVPEKNLNFNIEADNITYTINGVPANGNSVDSSLLIIYNWLSSLNLDEEDISGEMDYLKGRISAEWSSPQKRLNYALLKALYPKSPYAKSQNVEDATNFKSFTSKDLRSFYYKWYRPDMQAVIVVGDVNPNEIQAKIKSIFSTIPKAHKPQNREWYKPKEIEGGKVVLLQDREYTHTTLRLALLEPAFPVKYRKTAAPFIEEMLKETLAEQVKAELKAQCLKEDLPVFNIDVTWGPFMEMEHQQAFNITLETLPQAVYKVTAFLNSSINSMASAGFPTTSIERYKMLYIRNLEALYSNRANLPNSIYMKRATDAFLHGGSLASIELKYEYMQGVASNLTTASFNSYATQLLGKRDNRFLACYIPYSKNVEQISQERLQSAFSSLVPVASLSNAERSNPENKGAIWPEYKALGRTGSILSENEEEDMGVRSLSLSNGAKVLLKQNYAARDIISVRAVGKGGFSLLKENSLEMNKIMNEVLALGGVGSLDRPQMEALFNWYNMGLQTSANEYSQQIEGYCGKENLERLLQMFAVSFTEPYINRALFENYRREKLSREQFKFLSPASQFADSCTYYKNSNKSYVAPLGVEEIAGLNYNTISNNIKRLFSNAANFAFIISGDIYGNIAQIKELVTKYIATLPGNINTTDNWFVKPNYLAKGKIERSFLKNMEIPERFVNISYSSPVPYSVRSKVMCSLVQQMLDRVVTKGSIKRSANSLEFSNNLLFYPENAALVNLNFVAGPELSSTIRKGIGSEIERVATGNLTDDEFAAIKGAVAREYHSQTKQNTYWLDIISGIFLNKTNLDNGFISQLENISKEDFGRFVKEFITQGNSTTVIMEGTRDDVESTTLLRENSFIRDFFNVNQ